MSTGIPRAPIFGEMPPEPMSHDQVESWNAFLNVDEHRDMVAEIFGVDSGSPYQLSQEDLAARRDQIEMAKAIGHHQSRSTSQLGVMVLATVAQMENEFCRRTLLDVGAGSGRFGEEMARNAKAEVTFLDRDSEILERVSKKAGKIVLAEATQIPFEDESFERVMVGFSSVHWAETPEESVRALNEAVRVAEVGGSTIVIPVMNSISPRRQLLPMILKQRTASGEFQPEDRYAVVWALQDLALTNSLYRFAENGYADITWANNVEPTHDRRVQRELYSIVIDKLQTIPEEVYKANLAEAQQMVRA